MEGRSLSEPLQVSVYTTLLATVRATLMALVVVVVVLVLVLVSGFTTHNDSPSSLPFAASGHDGPEVMFDENDLIQSPLNQTLHIEGHRLEIHMYRMPDTSWTLEVVDELNNSTVWDGEFKTDQEALDTALADIKAEDIEAFIGRPPDQHLQ